MEKPRPTKHKDYSVANEYAKSLTSKFTDLKIRQYLGQPPNSYPHYFYKYISCDMSDEHIRCLLIDSDFYLGSCSDFNDPFDTTAHIVNRGTLKQTRQRFAQVVEINMPSLARKKKEIEISKMMQSYANNPEVYKEIFTKSTQEAGISCFTENAKDVLMWSHYASQHKGMLLQFQISKDPESLLYALKMDYSNDYPEFDISQSFDNAFEAIMLGKAKAWEYENEWRILRIGGAQTYQSFKHQALISLTFGCRSEDAFRSNIVKILNERTALNHPPVKVYKAETHYSKYTLKYFKYS